MGGVPTIALETPMKVNILSGNVRGANVRVNKIVIKALIRSQKAVLLSLRDKN